MVQIRIMDGDADLVAAVLERMLPLLRSSPELVVGSQNELSMRGPGRRVVLEVIPVDSPVTVRTERVDVTRDDTVRRPPPPRPPVRRRVRGELGPS